ncbi:MAG: histidine phosphatase family protein [Bacteroidales bacterium]
MKTLIVIRHSHAAGREGGETDFDRHLTSKGKDETVRVALRLKADGHIPDLIVTSAATRAFETAEIIEAILAPGKGLVTTNRGLYYATPQKLEDAIYCLPDDRNSVLMISHNPGVSELARNLSNGRVWFMENTQTLILDYDIEKWNDIPLKNPVKVNYFKPSDI